MKWAEFQQGTKCPICANKIRGNKRRHTYDYIKREIKKEGYELLSKKYVSAHIKLEVRCPKGHIYKVTWSRFYQGDRCPICNANFFSSKTEKEIAQIVESQGIKIKRNDRTQIINPLTSNKLELDIWVPKLNKAIEFNGKYWHSFKDKIIRDKIKTKQCVKKGIKLLVIKEQDWINNKNMLAFNLVNTNWAISEIDILIRTPFSFSDAASDAELFNLNGVEIPTVSVEHLIRMKEDTGREQDSADVEYLKKIVGK